MIKHNVCWLDTFQSNAMIGLFIVGLTIPMLAQSQGLHEDASDMTESAKSTGVGKLLSNMFGGKGAKLKGFIEADDTDGALAFYENEKEYFTENQSGNIESLKVLADKLNEKYVPSIQQIKTKLETYNLSELKSSQWPSMTSDLKESTKKISEYNSVALIQSIGASSKSYHDLVSLTDNIKEQLTSISRETFLSYD